MAAPAAFTATFQISTQNVNAQDQSATAVLADGRIAVVWKDTGTTSGDIKLQILNSDGTPAGPETVVNATTTGQQTKPVLTALPDGGFVVGWTSFASDANGDVTYRTFDASGTATMAADGTVTNNTGYQQDISLVALNNGQFAIGWNDGNTATTGLGSSTAAMIRLFDSTGALAPDVRLSGNFGGDFGPVLAWDGTQLLTAWDDSGGPSMTVSGDGIYTRTLTSFPTADFADGGTRVDTGTFREASNDPDVALTGAGPVITWDDATTGTVGRDIFVSINGVVSRVNTSTTGDQTEAAVAAVENVGFIVVWRDLNAAGGSDIRARFYDEAGNPTSADFLITDPGAPSAGSQYHPDVVGLIDGRFLVTWSDEAATQGINGRIFDPRTESIWFFGGDASERAYGTDFTPGDTLWGALGEDTLFGMGGDDELHGGLGRDVLDGGAGHDFVTYGDRERRVVVTLTGGNFANVLIGGQREDRIRNIEEVWGGAASDRLTGDNRANTFHGDDGNDTLDGSTGFDTITGGSDADTFLFTNKSKSSRDQITDFASGQDRIALSATVFTQLGPTLDAAEFTTGPATTADHRLLYDVATRTLSWDADGNGTGTAVALFQLQAGATLVFGDLVLV